MAQQKNKRGRPKKQKIFSAAELRQQAEEFRKASQARRLGIVDIDVEELCDDVMKVTGKHKFTRQEMDEMREKVDFIYQRYLDDKWEAEARAMDPYREALRNIELNSSSSPHVKTMTAEEWHQQHGLRYDGSKKRGPAPKPKRTVWDLSPGEKGMGEGPSEPVDFETTEKEIEARMMEDHIKQQKEEARFHKGRRVRRGPEVNRRTQPRQDFWI